MAQDGMNTAMTIGIGLSLALIGVMVGLYLFPTVFTALFPLMVTAIVALSTLGNFTFATLFAAGGLFVILLSVIGLLGTLGIVILGVFVAIAYIKKR